MGSGSYMTSDAGVCLGDFAQRSLFNRVQESRAENAFTAFCGCGLTIMSTCVTAQLVEFCYSTAQKRLYSNMLESRASVLKQGMTKSIILCDKIVGDMKAKVNGHFPTTDLFLNNNSFISEHRKNQSDVKMWKTDKP